jgi:hypothetical protein
VIKLKLSKKRSAIQRPKIRRDHFPQHRASFFAL